LLLRLRCGHARERLDGTIKTLFLRLRFLRETSLRGDDNLLMRRRERAMAKTKYRDLSAAAAKCAAFGRDDVLFGWDKSNSISEYFDFASDDDASYKKSIP
jgi:hypothetical protein